MKLLGLTNSEIEKHTEELEKEAIGISLNLMRMAKYMQGTIDYVDLLNMSRTELDNISLIIDESFELAKKSNTPYF